MDRTGGMGAGAGRGSGAHGEWGSETGPGDADPGVGEPGGAVPEVGSKDVTGPPPARAWLPDQADASPSVRSLIAGVFALAESDLPAMGLGAGLRPAADVDTLISGVASLEYQLARQMEAAARAGALPLPQPGGMLAARYWSAGWSRRLARTGAFAARHPGIAAAWAAGIITSEHVDALARRAGGLTEEEMTAVVEQLADQWGRQTPESLARFIQRVIRTLHPPDEPTPEEADAQGARFLSFATLGDSVILTGSLPRIEGEAVIAAVDAWAEKLRSAADHVPAAARRADGLVALVTAAAADSLPARGGLPVALTVTLSHTPSGDATWTTGRGHALTGSEQRFVACTADVTPIVVGAAPSCCGGTRADADLPRGSGPSTAARIAGLAATLLDSQMPLTVGRTQRSATGAQRRALATRDRGCVIPGCQVPAEACQAHHRVEWAAGGGTDASNLVLVCWAHHRQVDLGMWSIEPLDPGSRPVPMPTAGEPPGTPWPGNNGSPWIIARTPRTVWRSGEASAQRPPPHAH